MKITDVRASQPVGNKSPEDWRTSLGQILIAIDTDCGITGYGVGGGGLAGIHVVKTVLRDQLIGRNPEDISQLWNEMYQATLAFGRKGIAVMAISGVDLALWDLRGKSEKLPIVSLLGGIPGNKIPTYHTVWDIQDLSPDSEHAGYKLHLGKVATAKEQEPIIASIEQARSMIGTDRFLMVDAWMKWDVESTITISKEVAKYKLEWIEEPLSPDDLAGYQVLKDKSAVPIAGGEHEFTSAAFRPLIEQKLHTVLQPDVCWCGGLTELINIYTMADEAGLRVCPHRGCEIWALHAIAALDRNPLAETGRPWMTWVAGQPSIQNGVIELTDRPGFGLSIDEHNLKFLY
ncbi:MAG: mandelate racemase/muconate lactonizing enzyme family protein [Planctomycetes bacterium]|nr:mandelate racemase/muconate lactonizing enzyme family protein [Planctomycetota bacterium]MCH9726678.1 mandelate racemase/muconate lactonizing enzyme family protein [Planctomycetota bacterium]MCH9779586.1 mandelate racemase/muconate lactonizing enzyme family protein [Planctomycetota bacterium]MCH9789724.1 mandelate racemase/muconate lactonizing enzyme family protein [Planctomycetota bacterium]MDF1742633.1 mandelate racemase/muconate lactonizing enzyme family protein [Gimesia sp.]